MEVVSEDAKDRQRDYETKVLDYAEARVPEYWIINPEERVVIVHTLRDAVYVVHGRFQAGATATSALLPGFEIDTADLFAALDEIPE
jgi:Uma2 family endonuclease